MKVKGYGYLYVTFLDLKKSVKILNSLQALYTVSFETLLQSAIKSLITTSNYKITFRRYNTFT